MLKRNLDNLLNARGQRLRTRRVDEDSELLAAQDHIEKSGVTYVRAVNGGKVSGNYGHVAETEALVTVAFPSGEVYQVGARLNASNATLSGACAACLGEWARPLVDERFGKARHMLARDLCIDTAREALGMDLDD